MTAFTADVHHNEYLAPGATSVEALVRVTSTGTGDRRASADAAEVLIVDTSGSMCQPIPSSPRWRRRPLPSTASTTACTSPSSPARESDACVPGDWGAGAGEPGDPRRRQRRCTRWRRAAVPRSAGGSAPPTSCSPSTPGDPHAILLTDGRNESEKAKDLMGTLRHCAGRFQCDCRGAGEDWDVDELRTIASALLGTVDIIPDASDTAAMTADFVAMMQPRWGKRSTTSHCGCGHRRRDRPVVQQVDPVIEDLTARRTITSERIGEYPTGAWGSEARDYLVRITVLAQRRRRRVAGRRVSVVVDGEAVAEAKILAAGPTTGR